MMIENNLLEHFISRIPNYSMNLYEEDIKNLGLKNTWKYICLYILNNYPLIPEFLNNLDFGDIYETGLAIENKILKKKNGQYFTPDDVALVMSKWLYNLDGECVCDVGCGTGKLILTYLKFIGKEETRKMILSNKLFLYDFDETALEICKVTISCIYGMDLYDHINDIYCDFLDSKIKLPKNCKVISNPPYCKIEELNDCWDKTKVLTDTKEYYSAFMEKIFSEAISTVIITPFSFISGNKFLSLRLKMCEIGNGFIVSFDNVPGNIFCGKKHGIFNTNTANSVRAAITVFKKSNEKKGFKISPLIRFKNEERCKLLDNNLLENVLPSKLQLINNTNKYFEKISCELEDLFYIWKLKSNCTLKDYVFVDKTEFPLHIPNTCRYFTTASFKELSRSGLIKIYVKDKNIFNFIYCIINSSFAYWWWRVYDGGITYPINLLYSLPIPYNLLNDDDKMFFDKIADEMINKENDYVVTKINSGTSQENIKFPDKYRKIINEKIFNILGVKINSNLIDSIHSNCFFK